MKMLLIYILAAVAGIIVLLCVIALFVKKEYTITRDILINNSTAKVYDYVRYHKNQREFNQWLSFDPNTSIELKGSEDGTTGAIMHFESRHKKTGTGEWENTRLIPNERIELELRFLAPYQFTASGILYFVEAEEGRTKLIWEFNSGMPWPKNITLLFMDMDKIIGQDIEATLEKIKRNTEK
jgi:hypothetical protein